MTSPRTRTRRLFASAAAFALAVTGVAISAPSAEAAPAPRTFTAGFTQPSAEIAHGVVNNYALEVKNTSMAISAMDRIRVTIPEGFIVLPGSVSAPRGGWTESVSGSTLTAKTTKPLASGLRRMETLTVNFTATSVGCEAKVAAWQVRADGILLVFSNTSATPTVSVSAVGGTCVVSPGGASPVSLTVPNAAGADLPNGTNGPVSLAVQPCTDDGPYCDNGTEISLTGNFKGLYSNDAPATLIRVCDGISESKCAHRDGEGDLESPYEPYPDDYYYNYLCEDDCEGYGNIFGEREVEEDFYNFDTYISIRKLDEAGVLFDTPFAKAGRCVPLPLSNTTEDRALPYPIANPDPEGPILDLLTVTGHIIAEEAKDAGFCVDVNAITRVGNSFEGDLIIPILFVEDIKARP